MVRVFLGLVKGLVIGGGIGFLLLRMGLGGSSGLLAYAACMAVGALGGVVAGRAPWRAEVVWTTTVLKVIVGVLVGAGVCFAGSRFLPDLTPKIASVGDIPLRGAAFLSLAVGVLYSLFVEVDDGGGSEDKKSEPPRSLPAGK